MSRTGLNLDWKKLMPADDGEAAAELEVVSGSFQGDNVAESCQRENIEALKDKELTEKIQRMESLRSIYVRLRDSGAKLESQLKRLYDEQERRKNARSSEGNQESEMPALSESSNLSNGCSKAFSRELRCLIQGNRDSSAKTEKRKRDAIISCRKEPFRCASSSIIKDKTESACRDGNYGSCQTSLFHLAGNLFSQSVEKRDVHGQASHSFKMSEAENVVVLDEEDMHNLRPGEADKPKKWSKHSRIYFPSRFDPEAVELHHFDLRCLDPGSPLSSPIMNFYIIYLQRLSSPKNGPNSDYHFFNTFFYLKLVEAISLKKSDKHTSYQRMRRWWKGINIFQKAYLFLPIYADGHWSLVIICFPRKEDESGPIILHLDSLGYHASHEIFHNIVSFLMEEWNYLNQSGCPSDMPISEKVWKNLSRRIEQRKIPVPQQRNGYDCGLFVLFFIERFIMEAPERLRKKDLGMFGSRWFQPQEASNLRRKIRDLVSKQFEGYGPDNSNDTHGR